MFRLEQKRRGLQEGIELNLLSWRSRGKGQPWGGNEYPNTVTACPSHRQSTRSLFQLGECVSTSKVKISTNSYSWLFFSSGLPAERTKWWYGLGLWRPCWADAPCQSWLFSLGDWQTHSSLETSTQTKSANTSQNHAVQITRKWTLQHLFLSFILELIQNKFYVSYLDFVWWVWSVMRWAFVVWRHRRWTCFRMKCFNSDLSSFHFSTTYFGVLLFSGCLWTAATVRWSRTLTL